MANIWVLIFIRLACVSVLAGLALSFINSSEPMYVRGAGEAMLFAAGLNMGTGMMYYARKYKNKNW